jgi:hypothetical protein
LYYLGGRSVEDLKAGGGSDAPAREASSSKPAKKPEPARKTAPEPAPEATEEDEDVFQAAAELLMQDLDPAEEKKTETATAGESKAERKERKRAERRARKEAPDHATTSESSGASGPAGAARARALANQGGSDLVKDEEETGAEALTAAALVTRAFEGAVEVRPIANFKLLALPFGFHDLWFSFTPHLFTSTLTKHPTQTHAVAGEQGVVGDVQGYGLPG